MSPRSAKRVKTVQAEVEPVTSVLGDASLMPPDMPQQVLDMLARGLPFALEPLQADRHRMQTEVIEQVDQVLAQAAKVGEGRVLTAKQAMDADEGPVKEAEAKLQAAGEAVNVAFAHLEEQRSKLSEATAALKGAERELKGAEVKEKSLLKDRVKLEKQHEKAIAIRDQGLNALVEGCPDANKVLNKFCKDMECLGCESSLLASAPAVLLKKSGERKGFDDRVIESIRKVVEDCLISALKALQEFDDAGKDIVNAATNQRASVEGFKAAKEQLSTDLDSALERNNATEAEQRSIEKGSEDILEANRDKIKAHEAELQQLQTVQDSKALLAKLASRVPEVEGEEVKAAE